MLCFVQETIIQEVPNKQGTYKTAARRTAGDETAVLCYNGSKIITGGEPMTHQNKRPVFGVIAAQASAIKQREILEGIIAQAQAADTDITVLSNIYNPAETTPILSAENGIYDLICSEEFDDFLLIGESISMPMCSSASSLIWRRCRTFRSS